VPDIKDRIRSIIEEASEDREGGRNDRDGAPLIGSITGDVSGDIKVSVIIGGNNTVSFAPTLCLNINIDFGRECGQPMLLN